MYPFSTFPAVPVPGTTAEILGVGPDRGGDIVTFKATSYDGSQWVTSLDSPLPIQCLTQSPDGRLVAGGVLDGLHVLAKESVPKPKAP